MARQAPKPTRERQNPEKSFHNNQFKPFTAKTTKQKQLFNALKTRPIVIAHGPAGVGKSAVIASYAAEQLYHDNIERIYVTRPAKESVGEEMGFLPGELLEGKFAPYLTPLKHIFEEVLGKSHYEMYLKEERIVPIPMAYMRGMTLKNAIVIADEMQNSLPSAMEMLLTRIGENATIAIDGDAEQSDVRGMSGLDVALKYVSWMPDCAVIEFGLDDIVRSRLTSDIIQSFRKYKQDLHNCQV